MIDASENSGTTMDRMFRFRREFLIRGNYSAPTRDLRMPPDSVGLLP